MIAGSYTVAEVCISLAAMAPWLRLTERVKLAELARTELVQTEFVWTEVARTEVAQTEVAQTELV